jgi:RimJ/RimL family protein N-acetyltransferase
MLENRPMKPEFALRPAAEDDSELIFRWRNDEGVRSTARTRHEIGADEHAAWFGRVLADPERTILIAETEGRPVAQLRFDRVDPGVWEITISVDASERGRGIGPRLIDAGVEWLRERERRGNVVANVQADNERSRRAFLAAGFEPAGTGDAPGFERLLRRFG